MFLHLLLNNYLKNHYFIKHFILNIIITIIILLIFNFINVDYFIYCEGDDEITSDTNNKNQTNIVIESDNYYHIKKDSVRKRNGYY